jgi:hypothetical protein
VLICHVCGVKSPTGSWSIGNTETMLSRLKHYTDAKAALPGALVVFNANRPLSEQHVCQVHQADKLHGNPVLFTHGEAEDPNFRTLDWMQHGFSGATTFLSVTKALTEGERMSSTTLATIGHLLMGLAIIVSATVLLALHDLTETTAMALYAAAIGLIGGSLNTALALKVPSDPPAGS